MTGIGRWTALCCGLAVLTLAGYARADATGDSVVAKIDDALNRFKTLQLEYKMVTGEPGREPRIMRVRTKFKFTSKGKRQFTELLSPADVSGTRVLHRSDTEMYIYMPSYRKVRRIASHMNEQGFMGTCFSQTDMHLTRYGTYYTGELQSEDASSWTIMMVPKAGAAKPPYAKIEAVVEKAKQLPTRLRYFNDAGTHVKTETRRNYVCRKDFCSPRRQKMVDHTKGDKWTELRLKKHKVNKKIPNSTFSKRNLTP